MENYDTKIGQAVKATELYDKLELTKGDYSRFIKRELIDNPYCDEKSYFALMPTESKHGRFRQEYFIHIDFAMKLCMVSRSKKGEELRDELVKMVRKVENKDLLTHEQVLYLVKLKEVFKYISNCQEIQKKHLDTYVAKSHSKNPFAEFYTFRNAILGLGKEEINERLKRYCIENQKSTKATTQIEKLAFINKYEVLRNGIWDYLEASGSNQSMKLAELAMNMAKLESTPIYKSNENNMFQQREEENTIKQLKS